MARTGRTFPAKPIIKRIPLAAAPPNTNYIKTWNGLADASVKTWNGVSRT